MKLTGAQALIKSLELENVEVVFGLPGGCILPAYDPILDSPIRHILVRHEQGAGHMAEGYAHVTGRPGVALVTSGPAATNLVTPLCDAYMDSVPMVAITGQVSRPVIGTDGFQECDTVGITRSVTKHNELIMDPDERAELVRNVADTVGPWRGQMKHRRKDGSTVQIEATAIPVVLNGEPAILGLANDVTEKRQLEERLRHAQKMEAVGKLAGGVAHDFNNLLAVILGGVAMLGEDLGDAPAEVREMLASVTAAAERAAALTEQLLAVGRAKAQRPRVLDLSAVVLGRGPVLEALVGRRVTMRWELTTPLGAIEADEEQVEELLKNLAVNARDAMPGGGSLTVTTSNVALDAAAARKAGVKQGAYVSLVVADNGVGMDAATRARIFEPFFTTKALGEGTGLGLSVVFGIVKEAGGSIAVESEPGRGATFRLLFPQVGEPVLSPSRGGAAEAGPSPSARAQSSGTVLLVEDEEQVRTLVHKLLSRAGYTVIVTDGPLAALAALSERRGIDLVVTDLAMPGMDGRSMAKIAAERYPELRFLFMSGYAAHAAVRGAPVGPEEHFLAKPFTPLALRTAVRAALGRDKKP